MRRTLGSVLGLLTAGTLAFSSISYAQDREPENIIPKMSLSGLPLIRPDQFRGISLVGKNCVANYDISGGGTIDLRLFYRTKDSSRVCDEKIFSEPPKYILFDGGINGTSGRGKYYELNEDYNSNPEVIPKLYDLEGEPREA